MISFNCWHCGAAIRAKDLSAGLKGKCKECGKGVVVPTPVVEDAESAISELEITDWGVESDEQDPYAKMPNPSRTGKTRGSTTRSSPRFGRLPITTTKWEFKIIPMDSVERIFEVASEKQIEIDELRSRR